MHAKSLQLCLTLRDAMDCSPPDSSVHGDSQEYWSGLPCPPPEDLPDPEIEPTSLMSPALAGGFFTISATWEASLAYPGPSEPGLGESQDSPAHERSTAFLHLWLYPGPRRHFRACIPNHTLPW